eukprot:SAG11_NODE_9261_length_927_cov_4.385266_2_plen_95_part_00
MPLLCFSSSSSVGRSRSSMSSRSFRSMGSSLIRRSSGCSAVAANHTIGMLVPGRVVRFRVPVVRIFDPDFADLLMSARFVGIFNDQMLLMIGSQ